MTYFYRFALLFFSLLCLSLPAYAQSPSAQTDHATLELLAVQPQEDILWAAIELELEEHWHIYWKNPGDSGLEATISWSAPEGLSAGPIHWQAPKLIPYETLYNYGYEGRTALLVPFKVAPEYQGGGALSANIEFLICKDICIPQSASMSINLPTSINSNARIAAWLNQLPKALAADATYALKENQVHLRFDLAQAGLDTAHIHSVHWYPQTPQIISNGAAQVWQIDDRLLSLSTLREGSAAPDIFPGVLEIVETGGRQHHFYIEATQQATSAHTNTANANSAPSAEETAETTLLYALISAFIGGIILNIMPCVLPVLSLKALSIAKKSGAQRAQLRLQGLAYTAGIILSFLAVAGILIALQTAGEGIGWGFQLQSIGFVAAMTYLLFAIGLNLSGAFEIPSRFAGVGSSLTQKEGPAGSFFTGVLATIVATPCTAPFMATAIGFALSQSPSVALLIFASLGLGLAFPFLLITFIPAATRYLPKPGAWMNSFKQALAFPMYATVIGLLWVLTGQAGREGLMLALLGMLLLGFALWLLGKISGGFWQLLIIASALAALITLTNSMRAQTGESLTHERAFSQSALDEALASGKRVLVNATADWCITCKVNEHSALQDEAVLAALGADDMVYIVADWTNRNEAIASYLESFGRSGVPMYAYYEPGNPPVLLPQLLTPSIVLDHIQKGEPQ